MALDQHPILTLAELEAFDPRAPARGRHRRFCCPLPACADKPRDAAHRSLSVDTQTGGWRCFRCDTAGRLREWWEERPPRQRRVAAARRAFAAPATSPVAESPRDWHHLLAGACPVAGSPGARYLAGRGIAPEAASAAGVRYVDDWYGCPSIVFPFRDREGRLVAADGRSLRGRTFRAAGDKKLGMFATAGAWEGTTLVVTESPMDALSLAGCGMPALALGGKSAPAWLPFAAAFRSIALALDADPAGDTAAIVLAERLRSFGARVERWRPVGAKDWNEVLQRHGGAVLRAAFRNAD